MEEPDALGISSTQLDVLRTEGDKVFVGDTEVELIESSSDCTILRGVLEFRGDRLPYKAGTYEARYMWKNKHSVLCISEPFDLIFEASGGLQDVTETLLSFTKNLLLDTKIAESFGAEDDLFETLLLSGGPVDKSITFLF